MIINDYIVKVKKWGSDNARNLILAFLIFLLTIFSFWLGRITAPIFEKSPIIINYAIPQSNLNQDGPDKKDDGKNTISENDFKKASAKGLFVASKASASKVYHKAGSYWAQKIKPENQIWFQTEEEARAAGYRPAAN